MAKLADYYICDLRYTEEGYVILDEDEVQPQGFVYLADLHSEMANAID